MIDPTVPFRELNPTQKNYQESWSNEALLRLQVAWSSTYKNLKLAKEVQERQYNKTAVTREFNPGDLVWVNEHKVKVWENPKLTSTWKGPFLITKVISKTNAIIRKTPHSRDFNVHVNRLKPYHKLEDDAGGYLNKPNDEEEINDDCNEKENPQEIKNNKSEEEEDDSSMTEEDDEEPPAATDEEETQDETSPRTQQNVERLRSALTGHHMRSRGAAPEVPLPSRAHEYKSYKQRQGQ